MRHSLHIALLAVFLSVRPASAPTAAESISLALGETPFIRGHQVEGSNLVLFLKDGNGPSRDELNSATDQPPYVYTGSTLGNGAHPPLSSKPFADIIERASVRHGVDPTLIHAVIQVESGYKPWAQSPKGAMGLMQLMPATARRYGVADPFDPRANVEAGTRYLKFLLGQFEVSHALAAYNAGEGTVIKFDGIPPYRETRNYVARVLGIVDNSGGIR